MIIGDLRFTRKESQLWQVLCENAGKILTREDLLRAVWGYGNEVRTRTLDVHICRLRKKLDAGAGGAIATIYGLGYQFSTHPAVSAISAGPASDTGALAEIPSASPALS